MGREPRGTHRCGSRARSPARVRVAPSTPPRLRTSPRPGAAVGELGGDAAAHREDAHAVVLPCRGQDAARQLEVEEVLAGLRAEELERPQVARAADEDRLAVGEDDDRIDEAARPHGDSLALKLEPGLRRRGLNRYRDRLRVDARPLPAGRGNLLVALALAQDEPEVAAAELLEHRLPATSDDGEDVDGV